MSEELSLREALEGLRERWLEEAKLKCLHCELGWDLGAHGCHFEPEPTLAPDPEYGGITENCKAYGIRKRIRELDGLLAAHPVGVPSIPPRGRDNPGYRTDELEAALWLERNGYPRLEQMFHEFADGPISRARMNSLLAPLLVEHAVAIEQKSSTLCQKTPEGKEQE